MLKARIMVVEDEKLFTLALEQCLKALGHEVVALAATGQLMDIRLKGDIDGIEAASRIHDAYKTPIAYLTAYSDDNTLERARAAQPYGYVLKPFEEKSLKSSVAMALYTASINAREQRIRERLSSILADLAEGVIVADVKGTTSVFSIPAPRICWAGRRPRRRASSSGRCFG
jgi:CheY-like chemotaxis protein